MTTVLQQPEATQMLSVAILKIVVRQFSDLTVKMLDVFAEDGMVANRVLYDGIHTGTCMGISVTGKRITFGLYFNSYKEHISSR
ncbi:MAG: ester cyclase [Eubacteriaceae bacterium]|nr:ester cyclase [Eubacteriaceae bacterium]